jgi:hypothetical protein
MICPLFGLKNQRQTIILLYVIFWAAAKNSQRQKVIANFAMASICFEISVAKI